ncbi:hypothetical protein PG984_011714 [Apiospora sp. TS-2023a]
MGTCIVCGQQDSPRCETCDSAFYCSKACKLADWPIHRLLCESYAAFNASEPRPDSDHFRAILFYPVKRKPELLWLFCKWHQWKYYPYQSPYMIALVGSKCEEKDIESPLLTPVANRRFGDEISISYRIKFMIDGSAPNKSIASITTTKPGCHSDWRGRITAYGRVDSGPDGPHCRDLDMNDFPYIADFFLSSPPTLLLEQPTAIGTGFKYTLARFVVVAVFAVIVKALVRHQGAITTQAPQNT